MAAITEVRSYSPAHRVEMPPLQLGQNRTPLLEKKEVKALSWWQEAVVYQIYPRSFYDTDGDGEGDLRGITQKLDYLQHLGVGAIWLSPIYLSPMNDGGYDVADHKKIDPRYGTIEDFRTLVWEAHTRGIKIIMDLVTNHTSDQDPRFQEARKSRNSKYHDYYIWRNKPNNWPSFFDGREGSAWEYNEPTDEYYLHKFDVTQPDLNLRNPQVREEMRETMEFWLDEGVDGFRMDVIDYTFEDPSFVDMRENPNFKEGQSEIDRWLWRERYILPDEVCVWIKEVMDLLHSRGAVGIGEIGTDSLSNISRFHKVGLDLPFNFLLLNGIPFEPAPLKREIDRYIVSLPPGAWPNFVLENHDNHRIVTRFGREKLHIAQMMLLTLPGTSFIYYGGEIGMEDGVITKEQNKDPQGKRMGILYSRDPARTPMQWCSGPKVGFSEGIGESWLPVGNSGDGINVEVQTRDPNSLLNLTRDLITLRKANPALLRGKYVPLPLVSDDVYIFGREAEDQRVIVALNFSDEPQVLQMPEGIAGTVLLSTDCAKVGELIQTITLGPKEGWIVELVSTTIDIARVQPLTTSN